MNFFILTMIVVVVVVIGIGYVRVLFRKRSDPMTLGGMSEVCSAGDPQGKRKMATGDEIKLVDCSEEQRQFACGHEGPSLFNYDLYGRHIETDQERVAQSEQCGACIVTEMKRDFIRCCLCGQAIFPGEGVALYSGGKGIHKKWTTRHDGSAIGCLAWGCCPSGGFFGGTWTGKTVDSPFSSGQTAAEEALTTGKVIIGNVDDDGEMSVTRIGKNDEE